ncbi:MAG: hypothetical protein WC440_06400 [Candidatus Omnitrophota bacterium]|jgi:hypothetical protein
MKTLYYILYAAFNNSGPSESIYKTNIFDQEKLQYEFDKAALRMKNGDSLEYGKSDKKRFYPAMLYVEKENDELFWYDEKGRKHSYEIKSELLKKEISAKK